MVVDPARSADVAASCEEAADAGVKVAMLRSEVLVKISDAVTPQGCAAIVRSQDLHLDDVGDGDLVILDEVRDPGNLGAVVRVAEAAGTAGVVLTGSSADPFGPKALRASTGSTFRIPVVDGGALGDVLEDLNARGVTSFATSSHGGEDFSAVSWPHPMALVFGNEAHGLAPAMLERCERRVEIPLGGQVESLNRAVAAGILLFSSARPLRSTKAPQAPSTMQTMAEGEN